MPQSIGHQCEPLMVCSAQGGVERGLCGHCGIIQHKGQQGCLLWHLSASHLRQHLTEDKIFAQFGVQR